MKQKMRNVVLAIMLLTVVAVNMKMVLDTKRSYNLSMSSIEALSDGDDNGESGGGTGGTSDENIFPEDPFEGMGTGYGVRSVSNFYSYTYDQIGEEYSAEYKCPTTKVNCSGEGEVACVSNIQFGDQKYMGMVKNEDKKDPFI